MHLYCRRDYVNKKFRNSLLCYWWRFSSAPCHLTASWDLFWHHQLIRHLVKRLHFNVSVVFDGYDSGPSTQDGMHTRRRSGRVAHDIDLSGNIPVCVKMEQIISNGAKKQRLIIVLIRTLHGAGYGAIRSGIWQLLFIYSITHIYTGSTQSDNNNSVLQCCSVTS